MAGYNPDLRHRIIVVTGASSGLGKGVALACAKRGAAVVVAARQGVLLNVQIEQVQMTMPPPVPVTTGTLYQPTGQGVGVSKPERPTQNNDHHKKAAQ